MSAMNGTQMMRDGGIERPNTSTPLKPEYNYMPSSSEDNSDMNHHDDPSQKGTRFLGTKAVSILNKWFHENRDYPYPDDATTDFLANQAGKLKEIEFKLILSSYLIFKYFFFVIKKKSQQSK